MSKLKLMIIVGTRPEIIKLSSIIKKANTYFDSILVHTGQNYDYTLNKIFFDELEIKEPNYYLGVVGENIGQTMGNIIAKAYEVMIKERPNAILVLGDTNSCLSVIPAKRLKIPVFHMEAGNRCKDENLPEEIIRRIVDVTSDVNLCYSEHARRYILDSGVKPEYTFVTGSPMAEVISENFKKIEESHILNNLSLEKRKYILLSAHREENIDIESNFFSLIKSINMMAEKYNMPIVYSCHPRSKKKIEKMDIRLDERVKILNPFGLFDYIKLQQNAFCVISDSGTLPEECSLLKFPAVSIRTSTERPEAIEEGSFVLGGIDFESVLEAIDLAVETNKNGDVNSVVSEYNDINVSQKVIKLIQSYTCIINKIVWKK